MHRSRRQRWGLQRTWRNVSACLSTALLPLAPLAQMVEGWEAKLERVAAGEQRWGLFRARKPIEGRDFLVVDS